MLFDESYYLAINEARWAAAKPVIEDEILRESGVELKTCFDVACGPGWFSGRLMSLGLDVAGLEGRAELVEEAARRVPQASFHRIDLESRVETSRFEPRDLVFCFGLLYHTENPFSVVRNLAALTRKVLFVESQMVPEQAPVAWLIEEGRNETQGLTYHAMIPSRSALLKMIQCAGFDHVYESHHPIDHAGNAVHGAVADLLTPDAGIGRSDGLAVELVRPDQFPRGGIAGDERIVIQADEDILVGVASVIPEADAARSAPILSNGEGAAEVISPLAVLLDGLQDLFKSTLRGQCQRIAGSDLKIGESRFLVDAPQIRVGLKLIEQGGVVRLVVEDVQAGN